MFEKFSFFKEHLTVGIDFFCPSNLWEFCSKIWYQILFLAKTIYSFKCNAFSRRSFSNLNCTSDIFLSPHNFSVKSIIYLQNNLAKTPTSSKNRQETRWVLGEEFTPTRKSNSTFVWFRLSRWCSELVDVPQPRREYW